MITRDDIIIIYSRRFYKLVTKRKYFIINYTRKEEKKFYK